MYEITKQLCEVSQGTNKAAWLNVFSKNQGTMNAQHGKRSQFHTYMLKKQKPTSTAPVAGHPDLQGQLISPTILDSSCKGFTLF